MFRSVTCHREASGRRGGSRPRRQTLCIARSWCLDSAVTAKARDGSSGCLTVRPQRSTRFPDSPASSHESKVRTQPRETAQWLAGPGVHTEVAMAKPGRLAYLMGHILDATRLYGSSCFDAIPGGTSNDAGLAQRIACKRESGPWNPGHCVRHLSGPGSFSGSPRRPSGRSESPTRACRTPRLSSRNGDVNGPSVGIRPRDASGMHQRFPALRLRGSSPDQSAGAVRPALGVGPQPHPACSGLVTWSGSGAPML